MGIDELADQLEDMIAKLYVLNEMSKVAALESEGNGVKSVALCSSRTRRRR